MTANRSGEALRKCEHACSSPGTIRERLTFMTFQPGILLVLAVGLPLQHEAAMPSTPGQLALQAPTTSGEVPKSRASLLRSLGSGRQVDSLWPRGVPQRN